MQKIFLAIGHRQVEDYLENNLRNEFNFIATTVYREGIVKGIVQNVPDILIVRETLEGSSNIMDIVYQVRTSFPNIRIVFIAGKREPGDALLATLVSYGIYDILTGEKINVSDIIRMVKTPNQFADVMHLQPKTTIDEKTGKKLFEAPTQVVEKIYIEKTIEAQTGETHQSINVEKPTTKDQQEISFEPKHEVEIVKPMQDTNKEPVKKEAIPTKQEQKIEVVIDQKRVEEKKTEEKRPLFGGRPKSAEDTFVAKSTKQQILTFVGGKAGVGSTQIALNTAVKLAQRGFKTIFVELNDRGSAISYTYQIGDYYSGIDTALQGISEDDYGQVDKAIITTKGIVKNTPKENLMLKNYKKLPEDLDFMFFSQEYSLKQRFLEVNSNFTLLKDLCMYLSFQKEYDFIILDAPSDIYNKLTEVAIAFATKIFSVITQDVSSISSNINQLTELTKKRINLKEKLYYILNKYENAILTTRDIEDWISENVNFRVHMNTFIPDLNKEFIEANYIGVPILLFSKQKDLVKAFSDLEKTIF